MSHPRDALARLLELDGVAVAVATARESADRVAAELTSAGDHRTKVAAEEAVLRSAHASAVLEGQEIDLVTLRAGVAVDSVPQGALRVAQDLPALAEIWRRSPGQALARLHLLAAHGSVPSDELGRPRPLAGEESGRFRGLLNLIADHTLAGTSPPPSVLVAAVVHGELLTLAPFPGPMGVVARAAARLTLISSGFDPHAVFSPEVGHWDRRPEYLGAAQTYATGTPDGVRAWLKHVARAVADGAPTAV